MSTVMTPARFINKWRGTDLTERSAAQQHFIDLCYLLGVPTPADVDRQGVFYTFEKGATRSDGGGGFADVWYEGRFAWEYKRRGRSLDDAYLQLLQYREALENPPLLVVCDFERFQIHTNFTGTEKQVHEFTVDELDQPEKLELLRWLFLDPDRLRPKRTVQQVTEEAAERFARITLGLRDRGADPHQTAHFMVQLLFCLFAEDVGLLPNRVFTRLARLSADHPDHFPRQIEELLLAMRYGGVAGYESIAHFNGGLFNEVHVLTLTQPELRELERASRLDWSSIEPAIIGTLFERSLDPARRSQLGAHYTGRGDIERVVEPVVMTPLRRRWAEVRAEADKAKAEWDKATGDRARENRRRDFANILGKFQDELAGVRILDPACGSGNFLYVALEKLLDLEKQVIQYGALNGLPTLLPTVDPTNLYGLEINHYAKELTQAVIWIGYLQWRIKNGYQITRTPVLGPMETITLQDAILDLTDPEHPREPEWPQADFIIGNPPFLGGKRLIRELGEEYTENLRRAYKDRLPRFSDLCCYFFERARVEIERGRAWRTGLLATNSIRGGANRVVLQRIKEFGDIFMAWSDEPWILDGAAVRISIVGFDDGTEERRNLNGISALEINADLTFGLNLSVARRLAESEGISFIGIQTSGPFEVEESIAEEWLQLPLNPNARPNSDVLRRWSNAADITRRSRRNWIIDFGWEMSLEEAALYERPFERILNHVKPVRDKNRNRQARETWWRHWRPRPTLRRAISALTRYIVTPAHSKYRVFVWLDTSTLPDHAMVAFARSDDYFFGVLHSTPHELWSLRMGTSLEDRPRYTPTTCFETFPFPWPPGQEPVDDPRVEAIAEAARELNDLRERWLNPEDATEAELKKRTLTNLYNQRPTWLDNAHKKLDRAVLTAYGWDDLIPSLVDGESPIPDPENPSPVTPEETLLARLLALNLERAGE
jgi:type II restriction/modification system DNA methylase subunit YeeA